MNMHALLRHWKALHILSCAALLAIMAGCYGPLTPGFFLSSVELRVDMDANDDSATAVDLILVYDEGLVKEFIGMPADKYFANAKQFRRDYPQNIEVFHWEVVPGQLIPSQRLQIKKSSPLGAFVYARYMTPGDHRIRIGSQEYLSVHLMREGFELVTLESETASLTDEFKEPE